jgi:cellulose 1,4-beta-cellobiosidase
VLANTSTAFWVDNSAKIHGPDGLEGMLAGAATHPGELVVIVIYNVPNRDCDSNNSIGDICCYYHPDGSCNRLQPGDCSAGLDKYQSSFIDPIVTILAQYDGKVPMAVIVEPDSLPNLATNLGNPSCANNATGMAYTRGIPYAVNQIAMKAPSTSIYIDAAHGGWLGWTDNANAFATLFGTLQIETKIRGFATNVANYQPLGTPCPADAFDSKMHDWCGSHSTEACCSDPCDVVGQYGAGNNEYNYIQALTKAIKKAVPGAPGSPFEPHFIIDTGRNGVPNARSDCAMWCNPEGEGAGHLPTASTAIPALVDALFWIKPPGESDGCEPSPASCTEPATPIVCAHPDKACADAGHTCAPAAGDWFDYGVKMLAQNARFNGEAVEQRRAFASPFQPCGSLRCTPGYTCGSASLCVPTDETLAIYGGKATFSTRLEHMMPSSVSK